jgi:glycosyltransferase involved in cell wall biosynthesis
LKLWRRWRSAFDLIVAASAAVKSRLVAEGIEPVEVVWNGVPLQSARTAPAEQPTIVFAGRLVREKGVEVLLRAIAKVVAQVPEVQLLVAGMGPEQERLARLAASLGLSSHVSWLGHLSQPEMERRFAGAWVQVVPSLWAEPFGMVAAEAMMRGTAVVATRAGGLVEIVQDEVTGLLVPPGDVEALAGALLRLVRDPERVERMGQEGRQVAIDRFQESSTVDAFIHHYDRLVREK